MGTDFLSNNQIYWDELAELHFSSPFSTFYNISAFKQGHPSLRSIETQELGDVQGKRLLHLQCHFGMDSLSLARMGALVTGVDFSEKAISLATSLSVELTIPTTFIQSRIDKLPLLLSGNFDIVFTSYGVLNWLDDLNTWAQTISHFLKPEGIFYIVEEHPFACIFSGSKEIPTLQMAYPYQNTGIPYITNNIYSYNEDKTPLNNTKQYKWAHSMSEIINSLIQTGLRIEYIHEFHYSFYEMLNEMQQDIDGWWRLRSHQESIPLMFSLKATKER